MYKLIQICELESWTLLENEVKKIIKEKEEIDVREFHSLILGKYYTHKLKRRNGRSEWVSEREKLKKSLCTCFPQQSKCKFSRIRKPAKQIFIQRFFFSGDENSRLFLCENENFIFALLLLLSHCDFLCALLFLCDVLFKKTHTHTPYYCILLSIVLWE